MEKIKNNTFTIVTGSGRCGTTAIMQFLDKLNMFNLVLGKYSPEMKAGLEHDASALINDMIRKNVQLDSINTQISQVSKTTDIVKSPSFFIFNTYEFWKKNIFPLDIQVILLKRNKNKHVLESINKLELKHHWNYFKTELDIEKHYKRNIQNLKSLNIPYIELEFPKFILDPIYLYKKLKKHPYFLNNKNFNIKVVKNISNFVFDPLKITVK